MERLRNRTYLGNLATDVLLSAPFVAAAAPLISGHEIRWAQILITAVPASRS